MLELLQALTYTICILCFYGKMRLCNSVRHQMPFSTDQNDAQQQLNRLVADQSIVYCGWSLVAAIFATFLAMIGAHTFITSGRRAWRRRKSELRRQRLETAMVLPCEQEVAMAMRAKMIVIH